jgi:RNase P/RNase MRP subunit p29
VRKSAHCKNLNCTNAKEGLFLEELKGVTVNIYPSISRKKTGLKGRIGEKYTNTNLSFSQNFIASSTSSHIVEEFEHDSKSCVQL